MNRLLIIFICLILQGCAVAEYETSAPKSKAQPVPLNKDLKELTNIRHIYLGMAENEVKAIMGDQTNVGYRQKNESVGSFEAIEIKSPYKEEEINVKGDKYKVVYYFTHVRNPDGLVADDELTPLVFEGNTLIGKGNDFLFKLKNQ